MPQIAVLQLAQDDVSKSKKEKAGFLLETGLFVIQT